MKNRVAICLICAMCVLLPFSLAEESILMYNSKGDAVTALQTRLTELGYYAFRITGVYQENTQRAVSAFQAANGLPETGIADPALQRMIHDSAAAPVPTPVPSPTPQPIDLTAPFPGKVQQGNKGDNVRRIQTRLSQLGFYEYGISGEFGSKTRASVRDFQRQNALSVDGVVGEVTWQALFFDQSVVDAAATPRPTPAPTPVPYRVGIDVTNQVTTVYGLDENDEYTQIVRRMICSTGTIKDPTNTGSYITNGKTARWSYFPKWGSHAQYWTRIDAYNAFHSVLYREPTVMTLATGSYTGLGKRASHGCIRLMVDDAKWIFDNIGKGTEIFVHEGAADPELTQSLRVPPLDKSVMLPVPTAGPTPEPVYRADALPPMPFTTLRKGEESEAVYWLQCRLRDMGYYHGSITGGYYEGTMDAVRAFQRDMSLGADGLAGPKTLEALYADVLATPAPTAMVTRGPSGSPNPASATTMPTVSVPPRGWITFAPTQTPVPAVTAGPTWFE